MSKCLGCFFHKSGHMYNRCDYFDAECYTEPEKCHAFSVNGEIPPEMEYLIWLETGGVFGRPISGKEGYMLPRQVELPERLSEYLFGKVIDDLEEIFSYEEIPFWLHEEILMLVELLYIIGERIVAGQQLERYIERIEYAEHYEKEMQERFLQQARDLLYAIYSD